MEKRMTVRMEGVEKKVTSMVSQVESLMLKVQEKLTAQLRAPEGDTVDAMVDASESERLAAGATVGGMQIMGTEWDKIVATVELSKEYADAKKKSGTEAEMVKKAMVFDEYQKSVARAAKLDRLNSVVPDSQPSSPVKSITANASPSVGMSTPKLVGKGKRKAKAVMAVDTGERPGPIGPPPGLVYDSSQPPPADSSQDSGAMEMDGQSAAGKEVMDLEEGEVVEGQGAAMKGVSGQEKENG